WRYASRCGSRVSPPARRRSIEKARALSPAHDYARPVMFRRDRVDADAARQALWTGAVRTAIGIGVLLSPGRLLRSWGFPEQESRSGSVKALLRVLGGRDIVLGLATLAARDKPAALRTMVAASAAVDTGDTAVSICLATAS